MADAKGSVTQALRDYLINIKVEESGVSVDEISKKWATLIDQVTRFGKAEKVISNSKSTARLAKEAERAVKAYVPLILNLQKTGKAYQQYGRVASSASNKAMDAVVRSSGKIGQSLSSLDKGLTSFIGSWKNLARDAVKGFIASKSITTMASYNKQLLIASGAAGKYGVSVSKLRGIIDDVSESLSINRQETLALFKTYERGFTHVSFEGFAKLLNNIEQLTGSNAEAMQEYLGVVQGITNRLPDLQQQFERLNKVDRQQIDSKMRLLYITGELETAQYRQLTTLLHGNQQVSAADRYAQQQMKARVRALGQLERQFEEIAIAIGEAMSPILETVGKWLRENQATVSQFINSIAGAFQKVVGFITKLTSSAASPVMKGLMKLLTGSPSITLSIVGFAVINKLVQLFTGTGIVTVFGAVSGLLIKAFTSGVGIFSRGIGGLIGKILSRGGFGKGMLPQRLAAAGLGAGGPGSSPMNPMYVFMVGGRGGAGGRSIYGPGVNRRRAQRGRTGRRPQSGGGRGRFGRMGGGFKGKGLKIGGGLAGLAIMLGGSFMLDGAQERAAASGNQGTAAGLGLAKGAMSIGGGALTGASIGSIFGPIGTAIGAAVGGIGAALFDLPEMLENVGNLIGSGKNNIGDKLRLAAEAQKESESQNSMNAMAKEQAEAQARAYNRIADAKKKAEIAEQGKKTAYENLKNQTPGYVKGVASRKQQSLQEQHNIAKEREKRERSVFGGNTKEEVYEAIDSLQKRSTRSSRIGDTGQVELLKESIEDLDASMDAYAQVAAGTGQGYIDKLQKTLSESEATRDRLSKKSAVGPLEEDEEDEENQLENAKEKVVFAKKQLENMRKIGSVLEEIVKQEKASIAASQSINSEYQAIVNVAKELLDTERALNALRQSQSNNLKTVLENMQEFNEINEAGLINRAKAIAATARTEQQALRQSMNILDELEVKIQDSEDQSAVVNQMDALHGALQLTKEEAKRIAEAMGVQEAIGVSNIIMAEKRLNIEDKIGRINIDVVKDMVLVASSYDRIIDLAGKHASLSEGLVGLFDSLNVGVGASVQMREQAINAHKEQFDLLQKSLIVHQQLYQIASQANNREQMISFEEKIVDIKNRQLANMQQQANLTKALRDGWISAMSAMTTGQGRVAKILVTQEKSTGMALKYIGGMKTSFSSGAIGGRNIGYQSPEQFEVVAGNLQIGGSHGVNSPYSTYLGDQQQQQISQGIRSMITGDYDAAMGAGVGFVGNRVNAAKGGTALAMNQGTAGPYAAAMNAQQVQAGQGGQIVKPFPGVGKGGAYAGYGGRSGPGEGTGEGDADDIRMKANNVYINAAKLMGGNGKKEEEEKTTSKLINKQSRQLTEKIKDLDQHIIESRSAGDMNKTMNLEQKRLDLQKQKLNETKGGKPAMEFTSLEKMHRSLAEQGQVVVEGDQKVSELQDEYSNLQWLNSNDIRDRMLPTHIDRWIRIKQRKHDSTPRESKEKLGEEIKNLEERKSNFEKRQLRIHEIKGKLLPEAVTEAEAEREKKFEGLDKIQGQIKSEKQKRMANLPAVYNSGFYGKELGIAGKNKERSEAGIKVSQEKLAEAEKVADARDAHIQDVENRINTTKEHTERFVFEYGKLTEEISRTKAGTSDKDKRDEKRVAEEVTKKRESSGRGFSLDDTAGIADLFSKLQNRKEDRIKELTNRREVIGTTVDTGFNEISELQKTLKDLKDEQPKDSSDIEELLQNIHRHQKSVGKSNNRIKELTQEQVFAQQAVAKEFLAEKASSIQYMVQSVSSQFGKESKEAYEKKYVIPEAEKIHGGAKKTYKTLDRQADVNKEKSNQQLDNVYGRMNKMRAEAGSDPKKRKAYQLQEERMRKQADKIAERRDATQKELEEKKAEQVKIMQDPEKLARRALFEGKGKTQEGLAGDSLTASKGRKSSFKQRMTQDVADWFGKASESFRGKGEKKSSDSPEKPGKIAYEAAKKAAGPTAATGSGPVGASINAQAILHGAMGAAGRGAPGGTGRASIIVNVTINGDVGTDNFEERMADAVQKGINDANRTK